MKVAFRKSVAAFFGNNTLALVTRTCSKSRGKRGFSLLEFSLSFLVTIPVVVMTLDLTKIFQARSVAKDAIASALRCVTVTDDPECTSVRPASGTPLYNVRVTQGQDQFISGVNYDADARYLQGPQFSVGPFNARVLDQGFATANGVSALRGTITTNAVEQPVAFHTIGNLVPGISGGTNRNPIFTGNNLSISVGGSSGVTSASAVSGESAYGAPIYSATFNVPAIFQSDDCVGNGAYPSNSPSETACARQTSGGRLVRAIIHVRGDATTSSSTTCGQAKLDLQEYSGGRWYDRDLTGQAFRGGDASSENYYPRGYEGSDAPNLGGVLSPGSETESFKEKIELDITKRYRIRVAARVNTTINAHNPEAPCTGGQVSYRISDVRVFFPEIERERGKVRCAETVSNCEPTLSTCSEPKNTDLFGNKSIPPQIFAKIAQGRPTANTSVVVSSSLRDCGTFVTGDAQFNYVSSTRDGAGSCACSSIPLERGPAQDLTVGPVNCPNPNFGVADGVLDGTSIRGSADAQRICPVASPSIGTLSVPESQVSRWWTTKIEHLADTRPYLSTDCADVDPAVVKERAWAKYYRDYVAPIFAGMTTAMSPDDSLGQMGRESRDFPTIDPVDPIELVKRAPYNCGSFSVVSKNVSQLRKKAEFEGQATLFDPLSPHGHPNCQAGNDNNVWKRMLVDHMRSRFQEVENAFIEPRSTTQSSPYVVACGSSLAFTYPEELAACASFEMNNPANAVSYVLTGITDPSSMPAVCAQSCTACQLELVSINGDLAPQIDVATERATARAMAELNAFSPWLGQDCGDQHCARIQISQNEGRARARADIRVPLFSKSLVDSLFGGGVFNGADHLDLSYSSDESYERDLAAS